MKKSYNNSYLILRRVLKVTQAFLKIILLVIIIYLKLKSL